MEVVLPREKRKAHRKGTSVTGADRGARGLLLTLAVPATQQPSTQHYQQHYQGGTTHQPAPTKRRSTHPAPAPAPSTCRYAMARDARPLDGCLPINPQPPPPL